jgi:AcrR family transcriptional regulator
MPAGAAAAGQFLARGWPLYAEAMPRPGKEGRYHHGDLRAALIDVAIELIGERGVRGFSLAEASRRLGVAASAPYAHFADREDLLAAVAVHAYGIFLAELLPAVDQFTAPADRLAAMAGTYVRFAGLNQPLFELLFEAGVDKHRHPEVKAAEKPMLDAIMDCVSAVTGDGAQATGAPASGAAGDGAAGAEPSAQAAELAAAVEATAHGNAMLLLDGSMGAGPEAVELAARRAARATLALVESRRLLGPAP